MNGPARLSILHTCGEGHPSGQTRVILDLARGQAGAGHRVSVACPAGSPLEQMVRTASIAAAPMVFARPPATGAIIADIADACRADLVNAHSSRDREAVLWARRQRAMTAALVFTRHVRPLTLAPRIWWHGRQVDRIIAVSGDVARRLIARGTERSKIVVVPNGLPPDFLARSPDLAAVAESRARIVRLPQAPVVGSVARRKDQEVVLRAARHIARPLNIAFVGIPADLELTRLAARLPQHAVSYVPFVQDPRPYYACMDLSVIAWRHEGFGLSILESLALGIPFIGSREAAIPDLVDDGVDGLLVTHDDARAWARAIERLLDDRALATRLTEAGRRKAAGFTFERTLERTEAVYRDAIAARRGQRAARGRRGGVENEAFSPR